MSSLPQLSVRETATVLAKVVVPTLAKGPIIRRPRVVALAEKFRLEERTTATLAQLAARHPASHVLLRLPLRRQALVLEPAHVHRILAGTPDPFTPASSEKKAALAHFQPRNSLISRGSARSARRALQEQVLDSESPVHHLAESFLPVVAEEAEELLAAAATAGGLGWDDFIQSWYRLVRRVVFGDAAADDHELTDMLQELRADANWAFLKPRNRRLRSKFLTAVEHRLRAAPPGSLASVMSGIDTHDDAAAPVEQVPQWLFAFDPAGMATFRTLAAVTAHPEIRSRAAEEAAACNDERAHLPWLRACVLESLRLWPTTPMVLRQTTGTVAWDSGTMPQKCGVLIYAPFFHRDERTVPHANAYMPQRWLEEDDGEWALIPFSEGPAACPGRHLVLMLTSAFLSHLLQGPTLQLDSPGRLNPGSPLPGTLNNYSLRFTVRR